MQELRDALDAACKRLGDQAGARAFNGWLDRFAKACGPIGWEVQPFYIELCVRPGIRMTWKDGNTFIVAPKEWSRGYFMDSMYEDMMATINAANANAGMKRAEARKKYLNALVELYEMAENTLEE